MSDCPVCLGVPGYDIHMCGMGGGATHITTDNSAVIAALEARITRLERAIRKHRENVWGDGAPVEHLEDAFLYAALQEKGT